MQALELRGGGMCAQTGNYRKLSGPGMRLRLVVFACLGLVLASRGAGSAQDQPKPLDEAQVKELGLSLSSRPEYTEGRYGTRRTTEILYVPFKLEWSVTNRFELSLTVPYIREHGQNIFAIIGGRGPRGPQPGSTRPPPPPGRATAEKGRSDALRQARYLPLWRHWS